MGVARGVSPITRFLSALRRASGTAHRDEGRTESIPVKGVRKVTAAGMVQSAYSAPHVTVWKEIDASRTMELVKRLKSPPDFADIKVSPLLIMARAVIWRCAAPRWSTPRGSTPPTAPRSPCATT